MSAEKIPTQEERVLNYMRTFGSISRVEAMLDIGVANLPAVIDTLRNHRGYIIVTEEVKAKNRYGQNITYARYREVGYRRVVADAGKESSSEISSENI